MFAWNLYLKKHSTSDTPKQIIPGQSFSREPFWGLEIWRVKWSLSRDDAAAREGVERGERFFLPLPFSRK